MSKKFLWGYLAFLPMGPGAALHWYAFQCLRYLTDSHHQANCIRDVPFGFTFCFTRLPLWSWLSKPLVSIPNLYYHDIKYSLPIMQAFKYNCEILMLQWKVVGNILNLFWSSRQSEMKSSCSCRKHITAGTTLHLEMLSEAALKNLFWQPQCEGY